MATSATWANLLQTALDHWSQDRKDLAGKGLQQVLTQLQGPADGFWRALVHDQLALLSHELGHRGYSLEQWDKAQACWQTLGLAPGSDLIGPSLDWFAALLRDSGFGPTSERLQRLHQQGQVPLIDPQDQFEPLGGKVLTPAARPSAQPGPQGWPELLHECLSQAQQGKLPAALQAVDRCKPLASAQKLTHLFPFLYCAESIACFLAGDYSAAGEAKQEALRLWYQVDRRSPEIQTLASQFAQVLRQVQLDGPAELVMQRLEQGEIPLIDAWVDLKPGGLKQGTWATEQFHLREEWRPRIDACLRYLQRSQPLEGLKELGLLEQKLNDQELRSAPGGLVYQLQSLMAYAAGDYDGAAGLFRKAIGVWDTLKPGERKEGNYLAEVKSLLTVYSLELMGERLGDRLCDPFVFYKPEQQMQSLSSPEDEGDPRDSWEQLMLKAWQQARAARWEAAIRQASHGERVARLLGANDMRITYSLNSLALFSQASGAYAEAEAFMEDALRAWKRAAGNTSARTAWNEFRCLLQESEWESLAEQLDKLWSQPTSKSAFDPALLPREALDTLGMSQMPSVPVPSAAPGELVLPELERPRPTRARRKSSGFPLLALLLIVALVAIGLGGLWWKKHRGTAAPASPTQRSTP